MKRSALCNTVATLFAIQCSLQNSPVGWPVILCQVDYGARTCCRHLKTVLERPRDLCLAAWHFEFRISLQLPAPGFLVRKKKYDSSYTLLMALFFCYFLLFECLFEVYNHFHKSKPMGRVVIFFSVIFGWASLDVRKCGFHKG